MMSAVRRWFRRPPDVFLHDGGPLGGDVDWAAVPWPDPRDYDRTRILRALRAVAQPHRNDWTDAATMVRCVVGNDHRGTIYPAAVAMTEQLLTIVDSYPGSPRSVALAVLEHWWSGYEPESGFESYVDARGVRVGVIPEVARRITQAAALLTRAADDTSDPAASGSARALLTVLPLGWGHTVDEGGRIEFWGGRVDPDGTVHFPDPDEP